MERHDLLYPAELADQDRSPNQNPTAGTTQALVKYLHANGHFSLRDEDNFATDDVRLADVLDLELDSPTLINAVHSWRSFRPALFDRGPFDLNCHHCATSETAFRCGLPDVMAKQPRVSKWPDECKHELGTAHDLQRLSFHDNQDRTKPQAWLHGINLWNEVADLTLRFTADHATSRITADARKLSNYILAWSYLPNNDCNEQLQQAYNTRVNWTWHLLWTTICHEIGHAIGIGHGGTGIMQPAHDPGVHALGDWDIQQAVKRYGEARPEPAPPAPPAQPWHHARISLLDENEREIAAYDLTPCLTTRQT